MLSICLNPESMDGSISGVGKSHSFSLPLYLQLESDLVKKDDIIAAKDRRIAALEALDKSSAGRTTVLHPTIHSKAANEPNKSVQVSDDSCDVESDGSFGSLGLSFLRNSSTEDSQDNDTPRTTESDGRWNIPFDDSNEDDLVPKSSVDEVFRHPTALNDIGFKPIADSTTSNDASGIENGFAALQITPTRPVAVRGTFPFHHPGISPIVQAVRCGLSKDEAESDKENIDPVRKPKVRLSEEFGSPCR